jgi:hypothetical protein
VSKKHRIRKPRGSSNAGRPKKAGDRYPSGKLKPAGPNQEVIAKRKAGDAAAGEHPLDFAMSQGWINEAQHRTAMDYRAAYSRAHFDGAPRLAMGGLAEASPSEALKVKWGEMSDAEIVEIFDQVFSVETPPEDAEAGAIKAWARWKMLNIALRPDEREELFRVAILGSWPFWMPKAAADHALGAKDQQKRSLLLSALEGASRAMRPPKPKASISPVPDQPKRVPKAEVPVRYETPDGQPVQPVSNKGVPFEVAERRRRRDVVA